MHNMAIERISGCSAGRSPASAWRDLVWTVATAADTSKGIEDQTRQTLAAIDANLAEMGTDKTRIVSAQVFITDMASKPDMDRAWCEWIGPDPANWPQRACLGVALAGDDLVEIVVTAVRETDT